MRKLVNGQYVKVDAPQPSEGAAVTEKMSLHDALSRLDPEVDGHWNVTDGKPSLSVLSSLAGRRITRREVDKRAPKLDREYVKKARD